MGSNKTMAAETKKDRVRISGLKLRLISPLKYKARTGSKGKEGK